MKRVNSNYFDDLDNKNYKVLKYESFDKVRKVRLNYLRKFCILYFCIKMRFIVFIVQVLNNTKNSIKLYCFCTIFETSYEHYRIELL